MFIDLAMTDQGFVRPYSFLPSDVSTLAVDVAKSENWARADTVGTFYYKSSDDQGSYMNTNANTNNVKFTLTAGRKECIIPSSIEAKTVVSFLIQNSPNWVITADGAKPSGTPASWVGCKPKAAAEPAAAATSNGVRCPPYPFATQCRNLQASIGTSGTFVDTESYGNNKQALSHCFYTVMNNYLNTPGTMTGYSATGYLDHDTSKFDTLGNAWYTKDEVTTSSNAWMDSKRLKQGDAKATILEKVFLRCFQGQQQVLMQPATSGELNVCFLPPGMPLQLTASLAGLERLNTGIIVQVSDGAQTPAFTDAEVVMQIHSCVIRYQVAQVEDVIFDRFFDTPVVGSAIAPRERSTTPGMIETFKTAPVTKLLFSDIEIAPSEIPSGSTTAQYQYLTQGSDPRPDFLMAFVSEEQNPFSLKDVAGKNWDMNSWAVNKVKLWNISTSSGGKNQPPFLEFLPGNDYNADDVGEKSLLYNAASQNLFAALTYQSTTYPMVKQQMATATASWYRRGYTDALNPGLAVFVCYPDSNSALMPDVGAGPMDDSITFNLTFTEALAKKHYLYVVAIRRSQLVIDVDSRPAMDESDIDHKYSVDKNGSGISELTPGTDMQ